jgi:hypothetical protein
MFCFHQSVGVPVFQKSWLDADPGLSGEDDNGRQGGDSGTTVGRQWGLEIVLENHVRCQAMLSGEGERS